MVQSSGTCSHQVNDQSQVTLESGRIAVAVFGDQCQLKDEPGPLVIPKEGR